MWLGLSKVGVITALINTNLRKETLIHSICVASTKAIIVSAELLEALREIVTDEEISKLKIYVYDSQNVDVHMINARVVNLHHALQNVSSDEICVEGITPKDKLFYIYTSGTTGVYN